MPRTATKSNEIEAYLTILDDAIDVYTSLHEDDRAIPKHWEAVCNDADDAYRAAVQLVRQRSEDEPRELLDRLHTDIYDLMIVAHRLRQPDLNARIGQTMVKLRMYVEPVKAAKATRKDRTGDGPRVDRAAKREFVIAYIRDECGGQWDGSLEGLRESLLKNKRFSLSVPTLSRYRVVKKRFGNPHRAAAGKTEFEAVSTDEGAADLSDLDTYHM